ncbi:tRNA-uridine aminocarboxypropyltransferase [Kushneria phosphatilytica]|uniref:DTW domain-containing protein n=1 Tax=Kushneria phosphatilytica TaxID=657387 RepID=A0A1S1NLX1_9GAMM|nr:tRNA-uridine aminocarboxypropyltransferase [Kushneria phosphatilytica]OHV07766.1 DTW domain-containing protein [Kushneria phosphatilytica]QEL10269.1 DTW domain-containing protein [Kushneria phosphatilytica]
MSRDASRLLDEASDANAPEGPPRRPFTARGSFVERCDECRLPALNCLCPYRVEVASEARFWLITHRLEHYKPTNTGRLIGDCLTHTETFTWSRTEPDPGLLERLNDPRFQPFLIYPDDQTDYAERVVSSFEEHRDTRIPVFVMLDGTWRQARKMFRQSPYLQQLPIVSLRSERVTRYHLRKPASPHHLCTAEVAAELLQLNHEPEAAAVLDDYFEAFNDCYAASRVHRRLHEDTPAMARLRARRSPDYALSAYTGQ